MTQSDKIILPEPLEKLASVHDAVNEAKLERRPLATPSTFETFSYKAEPETVELASRILEQNCTTVSAYLRKCLELLVKDYVPTKQ